ncbi:MAG TPA: PEP-CTERM sorting domain-containing protein, partial [Burkholderiaceae bacterium]|nr:PEP-CTERM sorting domain-containing protein [Burkholderiaceae bacterium]
AMCLGSASSAMAVSVDVGGFKLPVGPFLGVLSMYENIGVAAGQHVAGLGEVTQLNGEPIAALCNGCELTYEFAFTINTRTPQETRLQGGYINFYLGYGTQNDFNPYASTGSAADRAAATNGQLFLTLAGHPIDDAGNTFAALGLGVGSSTPVGFGGGLADVDFTGSKFGNTAGPGALANTFFDTNGVASSFLGNADVMIGSTVGLLAVPHLGECPTGPECLAGSTTIRGMITAIPEPQTWGLMLAGLGVLGVKARHRRGRVH